MREMKGNDEAGCGGEERAVFSFVEEACLDEAIIGELEEAGWRTDP